MWSSWLTYELNKNVYKSHTHWTHHAPNSLIAHANAFLWIFSLVFRSSYHWMLYVLTLYLTIGVSTQNSLCCGDNNKNSIETLSQKSDEKKMNIYYGIFGLAEEMKHLCSILFACVNSRLIDENVYILFFGIFFVAIHLFLWIFDQFDQTRTHYNSVPGFFRFLIALF